MTLEQNPEIPGPAPKRSLLASPGVSIDGPKAIFWNERRAARRMAPGDFFCAFFWICLWRPSSLFRLHLPFGTRKEITASAVLVQEGVGLCAAFASAAILSLLEGRSLGVYGLPVQPHSGNARQGTAWGLTMITAVILLIGLSGDSPLGDLALRGSMLLGYAVLWGFAFLCVGFLKSSYFAGTRNIRWLPASDFGLRPRCCRHVSALFTLAMAGKTK